MDRSGALPDELILEVYDEEWVQIVDYEHIPFICCICHKHGHLFSDCPLNEIENNNKATTMKDTNSFHKVNHKGKGGKTGLEKHQEEGPQVILNKYLVLKEEEETKEAD